MDKDIQKNKLLLLGKLFATLTHEIRNPLSVLKINLEMIEIPETKEEENEYLEYIEISKVATERIDALVRQTIDFLSFGGGEFTHVSLNEVAKNARHFLIYRARKSKINLIEEYTEDIPLVVGNRNEILQIIINLVSNSLDATKEGEFVKIKTYLENDEIVLEVEDNGIGIKDKQQREIFNEFFTTKQNGTGLGLAVCNEIAKKHDAKLEFSSKYGAWTKFFVRFKNNGDRNDS